jgi:hypothetical protein
MALKLRVQRVHVAVVVNWYTGQLSQRFSPLIFSEAQREIMRREFNKLQQVTRAREKTNSWQIPFEINFNDNDGTWQVGIIDESNLLYLDDDLTTGTSLIR